jgi:uncharacterized protein YecE (DUF72 family)
MYPHWRGDFYPAELPQSKWLGYYAAQFDTVEINNSFYRLPEASSFSAWKAQVPPDFLFAVKASRFMTHMKKLKDPDEPLQRFFSRAGALDRSLGPVLYQLPPRWTVNVERLNGFLHVLPKNVRHVVEFRDPSWYVPEVFESLTRHGVALCVHDMEGSATGPMSVGPFLYLRFHGPVRYNGRYSDERLAEWAARCADQLREGRSVYGYFNNDVGGHAPRDALRLRQMLRAAIEPAKRVRHRTSSDHSVRR